MTQPAATPVGWQPPPAKPPLTAREKSGARLAGILGFLLLTFGFGLFALPLALLALGAFFALVFGAVRSASDDPDLGGFTGFVERLDPGALILPLVIASLLGLALIVGALFLSSRILRSHGVTKPWAVTWAGGGIAVVANWIVSSLLSIPLQLSGAFTQDGSDGVSLAIGVLSFLASVVTTAAIGWLSWWWMAHLMRPAVRTP